MEEALEVEPGALMIWSVIMREGGRKGRRGCGAESSIGLCCPHAVLFFFDQAEHTAALRESGCHCQVGDAMLP